MSTINHGKQQDTNIKTEDEDFDQVSSPMFSDSIKSPGKKMAEHVVTSAESSLKAIEAWPSPGTLTVAVAATLDMDSTDCRYKDGQSTGVCKSVSSTDTRISSRTIGLARQESSPLCDSPHHDDGRTLLSPSPTASPNYSPRMPSPRQHVNTQVESNNTSSSLPPVVEAQHRTPLPSQREQSLPYTSSSAHRAPTALLETSVVVADITNVPLVADHQLFKNCPVNTSQSKASVPTTASAQQNNQELNIKPAKRRGRKLGSTNKPHKNPAVIAAGTAQAGLADRSSKIFVSSEVLPQPGMFLPNITQGPEFPRSNPTSPHAHDYHQYSLPPRPLTPYSRQPLQYAEPYRPPPVVFTIDNRAESSLPTADVQAVVQKFTENTRVDVTAFKTALNSIHPIGVVMWQSLVDFYKWYTDITGIVEIGPLRFELLDIHVSATVFIYDSQIEQLQSLVDTVQRGPR